MPVSQPTAMTDAGMDADRIELLQEVLRLTLSYADILNQADLEALSEAESHRRALLSQCFDSPINDGEREQVVALLQQIQDAEQAIRRVCDELRVALVARLSDFDRGKVAKKAYADFSG